MLTWYSFVSQPIYDRETMQKAEGDYHHQGAVWLAIGNLEAKEANQ